MAWLKIKAAAQYMGLGSRTVRNLLRDGLPHSRLPSGTILLEDCQIDEYLRGLDVNFKGKQVVDSILSDLKL